MADRNKKEQLGARTAPGVRGRAIDAARAAGISFNQWVENAILAALDIGDSPIVPPPLEGQISLEDSTVVVPATGQPDPHPEVQLKRFDTNCSMRDYHWRCSPGTPCKRCGGET